jgi:excisionase family DNA binding protein
MDVLLTVREAAARLRISKPTLDRWRFEGRGPRYVRLGTRVLYPRTAIEEFLEANSIATRPAFPQRRLLGSLTDADVAAEP